MNNNTNEFEIDLVHIFNSIMHRLWLVILVAVIFGGAAFAGTRYLITPQYQASALMYVNNSSVSLGGKLSISSADLTAAQSLVDTYIVILKTRTTLNEVIEKADLDYSYGQLSKMISAASVNSTEVFSILVTCPDPAKAELIANTVAEVLPDRIADVVEGSSVRIVDYAVVPSVKSSPSYSKNVMIGLVAGLVLSVGYIVLSDMFDVIIRSEQYLTSTYNMPILSAIPDMNTSGSSGYYSYGNSSAGKKEVR